MNLIPGLSLRATEEQEILGIDDAEIGEFAVSRARFWTRLAKLICCRSMTLLSLPAKSYPTPARATRNSRAIMDLPWELRRSRLARARYPWTIDRFWKRRLSFPVLFNLIPRNGGACFSFYKAGHCFRLLPISGRVSLGNLLGCLVSCLQLETLHSVYSSSRVRQAYLIKRTSKIVMQMLRMLSDETN